MYPEIWHVLYHIFSQEVGCSSQDLIVIYIIIFLQHYFSMFMQPYEAYRLMEQLTNMAMKQ